MPAVPRALFPGIVTIGAEFAPEIADAAEPRSADAPTHPLPAEPGTADEHETEELP